MHKTAEMIEESKAVKDATESAPKRVKKLLSGGVDPMVGKATQFKPGNCANPGGRPKHDLAAQLARAVIEGTFEQAARGLAKQLAKGNAYTFKELAERGYGKLTEFKEVTHIHGDLSDQDLDGQISRILRLVGTRDEIDALEPAGGKAKTNGAAKDHDLLPR